MTGIAGIAGLGAVGVPRAAPRRAGVGGFSVPEEAAAAPGVAGVAMQSLLGLQEAGQDAVRDREARRHGGAILAALAALQRALLGGADAGALASLAALVERVPLPADPRLAEVQHALLVRAAVELARAQAGAFAAASA